jgi:hypothetical protein
MGDTEIAKRTKLSCSVVQIITTKYWKQKMKLKNET